jgi:hypothetical protein
MKTDVNVPSKSNKHKNYEEKLNKKTWQHLGSRWQKKQDQDLDPDHKSAVRIIGPDPDRYQNVMDPQYCCRVYYLPYSLSIFSIFLSHSLAQNTTYKFDKWIKVKVKILKIFKKMFKNIRKTRCHNILKDVP